MRIRHVGVAAAMAIFAGTMIGRAGPAQATRIPYTHNSSTDMTTYPGGPSDGTVDVFVDFLTSLSEGSVAVTDIFIENRSNHTIVVDADRWQSSVVGSTVYRGPGGTIDWNPRINYDDLWQPQNLYLFLSEDPFVYLHFHAQTRPALQGTVIIPALPVGPVLGPDVVGLTFDTSGSFQASADFTADPASAVPEPRSAWIMLTGLLGLIGYHWRSRLFPGQHSA